MLDHVQPFYDALADFYHLIFDDWDQAIARQGRVIDALLRTRCGAGPLQVLDCACGIGTQAIGLAALGHHVTGSDLSPAAVERARREVLKRGLEAEFHVSDMTQLAEVSSDPFDVVIAFDNALPHLSADQLLLAAQAFRRVLRAGGMFIAGIRNYDELIRSRPTVMGPSFIGTPGARRIVHQVWDWTGTETYDAHLYISLEQQEGWKSLHFVSKYRCLLRAEIDAALRSAGFAEIEWVMPEASGSYQPVVTARAVQA